MEKFLDLSKNYLLFLCNDHEYSNGDQVPEKTPDFINEIEMKMYYEQKLRFVKKETEHRNFIRAFMFDYIFKTFIQLLDESLGQRDKFVNDKQEEWQYFSNKKCDYLQNEVHTLLK
jgi:hypothetical protein